MNQTNDNNVKDEEAADKNIVEASCIRCYVWSEDLNLDELVEAIGDTLVEHGYGVDTEDEDEPVRSLVLVTPDSLPFDGTEKEIVEFIEDIGAGILLIPGGTLVREKDEASGSEADGNGNGEQA